MRRKKQSQEYEEEKKKVFQDEGKISHVEWRNGIEKNEKLKALQNEAYL